MSSLLALFLPQMAVVLRPSWEPHRPPSGRAAMPEEFTVEIRPAFVNPPKIRALIPKMPGIPGQKAPKTPIRKSLILKHFTQVDGCEVYEGGLEG